MERQKEKGNTDLQNLPTEVLLVLLNYLEYEDIIRLSILCKRFYTIIKDDSIWRQKSNRALVTNLQDPMMRKRSEPNITFRERVRISSNWKYAKYKQLVTFDLKGLRYMPWLCLVDNLIWLGRGSLINAYKKRRNKNGQMDLRSAKRSLRGHLDDVNRFVHDNGVIASGGRDWAIFGFSTYSEKVLFFKTWAHNSEVTAIDLRGDLIVSGCSKEARIKVWRISNNGKLSCQRELGSALSSDWTLSIALRPMSDDCLVGSSGHNQKPITVYNLEHGCETVVFNNKFLKGSGVKDISWETPHTVLTAGYDTYIRLWDCRTGKMEQSWGDLFDSAVYCLATDKSYTMVSGTYNNNRVQLWDKRQAQSVQGYFFCSPYNPNSSIYTVAFDAHTLYAGLDYCVSTFDFSGYKNKSKSLFAGW